MLEDLYTEGLNIAEEINRTRMSINRVLESTRIATEQQFRMLGPHACPDFRRRFHDCVEDFKNETVRWVYYITFIVYFCYFKV